MKIVAIGGEPGSGKTTLMKELLSNYTFIPLYDKVKLVPYLRCENIYVLGKYEETGYAQGTDRMSMAVQPEAIKFLESLPKESVVLFEGDRLFNQSFLEHCNNNYDLNIIYLKTTKETRKERYKERGSNQNETWLAGRDTKVQGILTNFELMPCITKLANEVELDKQNNLNLLKKAVFVNE
jgi:broad-specificity NMP kinase